MREVNCIVPVRIRVTGRPEGLDLDLLGDTVTETVQSRLRFARETIASRYPVKSWLAHFREPEICFRGKFTGDSGRELARTVRQAIAKALSGQSTVSRSPFI